MSKGRIHYENIVEVQEITGIHRYSMLGLAHNAKHQQKKKDPPKDKTISNLLMFPNLAIAFIPIVVIRVTFYNQYFLKRFETMIEMWPKPDASAIIQWLFQPPRHGKTRSNLLNSETPLKQRRESWEIWGKHPTIAIFHYLLNNN